MALCYQFSRAVITLIIFVSSGVLIAEGETVRETTTPAVKSNITEHQNMTDNSTENPTQPDNQEVINTSTERSNNDSNTVTQNPSVKQISTRLSTQKKDIDTTQNPPENTDSRNPQSNANGTDDKGRSEQPSVDTATPDTEWHKSSQTNARPDVTPQFVPVTFDTRWMDTFFDTHHFEGQYMFCDVRYLFDFVVRYKHPNDPRTLVTNFYDADGAVLEFNGTSADGHKIVFTLSKIYTPGVRFPLHLPLQVTGSFARTDQPYFTGNFTKPTNTSFSWFRMNKGLGAIETGETAGTRTAIVIIIPTSIAFLGICGTVAIICWASKKGYLRGRHKSYRLFTDAQVSYESEAETIHI